MKVNRLCIYFLYSITLFVSNFTSTQVKEINTINEYAQIAKQNKPVLVKFAADWCGVCEKVKAPFQELAQEKEFNTVTFVNIDIDKSQNLAEQHQIAGVPTFIYINNGKSINQNVGIKNLASFKDDLRSDLRTTFNLAQNKTTNPQEITKQTEQQDVPQSTQPKKEEPTKGIVSTINDFFRKIIEMIGTAIKYVIDKIMNMFK